MSYTQGAKNSKVVSCAEFKAIREKYRKDGKKVMHCHGAFDLLHPGHIAHLEEAKSVGDVLVVSVTSAPYINKGPGRPYFSDELRMKSLAALECVDHVLLAEEPAAFGILAVVQPDFYVKGAEYAKSEDDVTQNIDKEVERVRSFGGDIYFTGGEIFSSTRLINNAFSVMPPKAAEYAKSFSEKFSFNSIREIVESMKSLKILVVGDIIIDEYIFCSVQGIMSKDMGYSVRYQGEERYLGGSLAIARHLSGFSDNVTVCGVVGEEPHIHSQILNDLSRDMHLDLQFDPGFKTVVKRRFVRRHGIRNEYDKVFSINYLNEEDEKGLIDKSAFYKRLESSISDFDMVLVADFGHGLIDRTVMDIVQEKSRFVALNCQTNSSNYGMNLITKYKRADTFTLDERELRLATGNRTEDVACLIKRLMNHFKGKAGWVTLGSFGAMGIDNDFKTSSIPALTLTVQDTVGAGDAFFAISSMCAAVNAPMEVGTFLGSIAGAIAANIMGNSKAVTKVDVLKFASTMLKF
ncbi:MAG: PfkB family carbohydrate kinase [Clostridia bacterium]|nr:PfkB family carbohydrate kinase [Clostridia bacterium]